ncbi:hypothetical protein RFI_20192 [Reticulomyxa filosa]|uniref:Uncharacterized protein n=1 Tax=Reticulomyxa filosa TaxID=46433 RepID=X6MUL5_RETFI|nr:hypothetical protein RFI_20192 [Reticulomyxa filosa]|eukprot:ETO17142.1 hypothetical protein RFI_20192 [Reticulomyxa filosa]
MGSDNTNKNKSNDNDNDSNEGNALGHLSDLTKEQLDSAGKLRLKDTTQLEYWKRYRYLFARAAQISKRDEGDSSGSGNSTIENAPCSDWVNALSLILRWDASVVYEVFHPYYHIWLHKLIDDHYYTNPLLLKQNFSSRNFIDFPNTSSQLLLSQNDVLTAALFKPLDPNDISQKQCDTNVQNCDSKYTLSQHVSVKELEEWVSDIFRSQCLQNTLFDSSFQFGQDTCR